MICFFSSLIFFLFFYLTVMLLLPSTVVQIFKVTFSVQLLYGTRKWFLLLFVLSSSSSSFFYMKKTFCSLFATIKSIIWAKSKWISSIFIHLWQHKIVSFFSFITFFFIEKSFSSPSLSLLLIYSQFVASLTDYPMLDSVVTRRQTLSSSLFNISLYPFFSK